MKSLMWSNSEIQSGWITKSRLHCLQAPRKKHKLIKRSLTRRTSFLPSKCAPKTLPLNNPAHIGIKKIKPACPLKSSRTKSPNVKHTEHNQLHNFIFLRRNNALIIKLPGKLALIIFFGYQSYHFSFRQSWGNMKLKPSLSVIMKSVHFSARPQQFFITPNGLWGWKLFF